MQLAQVWLTMWIEEWITKNDYILKITYRTLWSLAVLTHGSTWFSIHTTTECIITPLE